MPTEQEEKDAMKALLSANNCFGRRWISLGQCFRLKYIPQQLKDNYARIMALRYPTSNFNWYGN